jgi:EmrB/QacA subfamily drug resistance transporter
METLETTMSEITARTVGHPVRTFVVTSVALFMASLDNLVVTMALPQIRQHLHAGIQGLQWTVNAYTLTFAVFLLMGAALGDRFGRRKLFLIGLAIFTLASAGAALAPSIGVLIAFRAIQGLGGAIVMPLTLTLLSNAVPPEKRGMALGGWGAIGGLAIALGPVIGGSIVEAASWQWIFWLNVPIGIAMLPLSRAWLAESKGAVGRLDVPGTALVSTGLFGVVFGMVRGDGAGWTSAQVLAGFVGGAALLAGFVLWERRTKAPMLPLNLFRHRGFTMSNIASMLFMFGMFGSVFLLSQFLQTVQGYSPLASGVRTLPWTAMPMVVAPIAGMLSDRIGGRPLVASGLALLGGGLAWLNLVVSPTASYASMVPAFIMAGVGTGLFFAPIANVVLSSVARHQEGIASGANNAIRELGGVLGTSVLGAVFSARGGYGSGQDFVNGLTPAVWVGVAVVGAGAVAALLIPTRRRAAQLIASSEQGDAAGEAGAAEQGTPGALVRA